MYAIAASSSISRMVGRRRGSAFGSPSGRFLAMIRVVFQTDSATQIHESGGWPQRDGRMSPTWRNGRPDGEPTACRPHPLNGASTKHMAVPIHPDSGPPPTARSTGHGLPLTVACRGRTVVEERLRVG